MTSAGPCGGPAALQSLAAEREPGLELCRSIVLLALVSEGGKNKWRCPLVPVRGHRGLVCVEIWRCFLDL